MTTTTDVEVDATLHATLDMSLLMSPQHFLVAAHWFQHLGTAELAYHQQQKAQCLQSSGSRENVHPY